MAKRWQAKKGAPRLRSFCLPIFLSALRFRAIWASKTPFALRPTECDARTIHFNAHLSHSDARRTQFDGNPFESTGRLMTSDALPFKLDTRPSLFDSLP